MQKIDKVSSPDVHRPKKKKYYSLAVLNLLYLPLTFVWFELVARVSITGFVFDRFIFLSCGLVFFGALILSFIISFSSKKAQRLIVGILIALITVYYGFYIVYHHIFKDFFKFSMLEFGGDAITQFWRQTLDGIVQSWYKILVLFIPLICWCIFAKLITRRSKKAMLIRVIALILAVLFFIGSAIWIKFDNRIQEVVQDFESDIGANFSIFGLFVASLIDAIDPLLTSNTGDDLPDVPTDYPFTDFEHEDTTTDVPTVTYGYNELNIDFDTAIQNCSDKTAKAVLQYISTRPSTQQNEYTGMFKGKNLIFLTLEGFSGRVIDPELTPTLYMMANLGFVFTNFYDSLWGGSTATGEYSNMTGNFYRSAKCLKMSASTIQYSSLGNLFKAAGYPTQAYHNHTYTYYDRNVSHPNFGYEYKGIGKGLTLPTNSWPRSDLEMSEATFPMFPQETPYHVYYMTVSGHCNYSWTGNKMSARHRKDIPETMEYCENVKAYFACQLEVELMLTDLVEKLRANGQLDDTVFAMCCDHYPYALSDSELSELYGLEQSEIRKNLDLYRNSFILWSSSMQEPVVVDEPCSSIDMVPTLANLFGLDYDSRLISGVDILSTTENIAIVNTELTSWNWVTRQGTYFSSKKQFVPSETCTLMGDQYSDYVKSINSKITSLRKFSNSILENNLYKYLFNKDYTLKYSL